MNPNICVVVPVRNRIELTKRFLEAFFKSTYKCFTMVIVDDASTDSTVEYITKKYPEVVLLHGDGNLWWTGATNMGVKYAIENNYDYVLTINNDSVVEKELPNLDDAHRSVLEMALKVKDAREKQQFDCPRGLQGCFHCQPFEKILKKDPSVIYVGIGGFNQDIYVVK